MKLYPRLAGLVLFVAATLLLTSAAYAQGPPVAGEDDLLPTPSAKKDLYPADADAAKDIKKALQRAAVADKRVLLVFGGNWCYDCHVLDHALHEGAAGEIMTASFLLVHVDIGEANKNLDLAKKYNIPLEKGVPAVAVLSGAGALLYSSGDGKFEAARSMMRKDLVAFLKRWQEEK
jgi:thioredoxin-related protein